MDTVLSLLILVTVVSTVSHAACNFTDWGTTGYVTRTHQDLFPNKNTTALIQYKTTYAFISSIDAPQTEIKRYECDAFEKSGEHHYYIRKEANSADILCVDDIKSGNDVILHREKLYDTAALGSPTMEKCKTALAGMDLFDVYLSHKVVIVNKDERGSVKYPLPFQPYRVTFTPPGGTEECKTDRNSVLVVTLDEISILACKYSETKYAALPLTGLIRLMAVIDPTDLGEPDDSNGCILIWEWSSASLKSHDHTHSVRASNCNKPDGETFVFSVDLKSSDINEEIKVRKGHRFDETGVMHERNYTKITLITDMSLVSAPPVLTTPRQGGTAGPSTISASTTQRPLDNDLLVQFSLHQIYSTIAGNQAAVKQLLTDTKTSVTAIMKVGDSRINEQTMRAIEGKDGKTVIIFELKDGIPSTTIAVTSLENVVASNAGIPTAGDTIAITQGSVYTWRATDNCQTAKCQNGGECLVNQGEYSCTCPVSYTGDLCQDEYTEQAGENITKYIIIGVVVGLVVLGVIIGVVAFLCVRRHRRKTTGSQNDNKSQDGYDNAVTMEDRDREIYSTIQKRPKAYHERSFSSLDRDKDYGERTGIHL